MIIHLVSSLQFTQVQLTEIIRNNIELSNYTKPTPVQVMLRNVVMTS